MADRPIIFSAPMVRALLDGRKTQTRRLLQGEQIQLLDISGEEQEHLELTNRLWPLDEEFSCLLLKRSLPFARGDRLYVRERAHIDCRDINYAADCDPSRDLSGLGYRPSVHMPRWASRLTLTVTDVRVQRLQEISEEDARAEGVIDAGCTSCGMPEPCGCASPSPDARDAFAGLWNSLHGPGAWAANPWVVALTFTVERRNIDVASSPTTPSRGA